MKKVLLILAIMLFIPLTAQAMEFISPAGNKGNVSISQSENHKNLYTAAASVTASNSTLGDFFVAGGTLNLNGTVEKDLFAAGGTINVNGSVGDDARIAGGNISINSPIIGDLLIAGGSASISEKSSIGGDLAAGVATLIIDAPVNGNVKITGSNVTINSKITGSLDVQADKLTFGSHSDVSGHISYKGPQEAEVITGGKVSAIEYTKLDNKKTAANQFQGLFTLALLIKLIALFLATWLFLYLWPIKIQSVVHESRSHFWKTLGIGFLALIAPPIIALILLVTGVGSIIGVVVLLAYLLTLVIAAILSPLLAGSLLFGWYKKQEPQLNWKLLILGVVATTILSLIPIIGWLVYFILFLSILGSLVEWIRASHKKEDSAIETI